MQFLVVIAGPTAIGKTGLSIELAKHFNCPIISADSRQFYKETNIGTAKPTMDEMDGVPHFFLDFLSIHEKYTAGQYEKDVIIKLNDLFKSHNIVILTGGSGLYIDAITNGIDEIPSNEGIKSEIEADYNKKGIEYLVDKISELDPEYAKSSDLSNPQRLIRAIEACIVSGKKYSDLRNSQPKNRNFKTIKIVLNQDRELLYNRINSRVEIMMKKGLENEVRNLYSSKKLNALNTVGYKELFAYFDGSISKNKAVELIKQNSRRYAKRQLTWFRKDKNYKWFEPSQISAVIKLIETETKSFCN